MKCEKQNYVSKIDTHKTDNLKEYLKLRQVEHYKIFINYGHSILSKNVQVFF